ncbi:hypothetical protein ETAA1_05510 [Urbifossiella limnaea]|uniref:Uncharacterized protein n=1 Tax=Urbifossiella limnaea TaxID=2528023 RepID=A0A517XMB8_9BACT|nr:hypothetical protein ETAA1_05510 [Urbifossiella limnaea]
MGLPYDLIWLAVPLYLAALLLTRRVGAPRLG